jgi:FMN reductase
MALVRRTPRVAVLCGSPVPGSRTWSFASAVGARLAADGVDVQLVDLRALPAAELLHGAGDAGPVRAALDGVARAHGVVVATPVHHAAYSGILKAFLDLLPRSALAGKVALPLAVGGSTAHVLAIDYAVRPVLVALGAAHVTRGHFLLHTDLGHAADGSARLEWEAERRLEGVLEEFVHALGLYARDEAAISLAPDPAQVLMIAP